MATLVSKIEHHNYFRDEQSIVQEEVFPLCLLDMVGPNTKPNTTMKYSFIMPSEQFEKLLKPHFKFKSFTTYRETFYDTFDNALMNNSYWFKTVSKSNHVVKHSLKKTEQMNGKITYKEKILNGELISDTIFLNIIEKRARVYAFDVERTEYELEKCSLVKLTLDRTTFSDNTSFVGFSITGPNIDPTSQLPSSQTSDIAVHAKPCRSKIIEYLHRSESEKSLYTGLIVNRHVDSNMVYATMCIATFEKGEEEANQFKDIAERVRTELEKAGGEKKEVIEFRYRNILKYGDGIEEECEDFY